MKRLFVLFVLGHLLIDLAAPSLPGAFRFNPDESVVGVKVQAVQLQDGKPAAQVSPHWEFLEPSRFDAKTLGDSGRDVGIPDPIAFLPRRVPSPDISLQGPTEDH